MPACSSLSFLEPSDAWFGLTPGFGLDASLPGLGLAVVPVVLAGTDDEEDEELGEEEELPATEPADDESEFDDFDDEFDDDFEEEEDDPDWDHPDDGDAEPPPAQGTGKKK
jgi:hypothetical protein